MITIAYEVFILLVLIAAITFGITIYCIGYIKGLKNKKTQKEAKQCNCVDDVEDSSEKKNG